MTLRRCNPAPAIEVYANADGAPERFRRRGRPR